MRESVLLLTMILAAPSASAQRVLVPSAGLAISEDAVLEPGEYYLPADSSGAIIIRSDSVTVDFTGVILRGSPIGDSPDTFSGTAIRVEGASGVTLKGVRAHGYRHGIWATDASGLTVEGGDLSYNYRQRLKSTIEREHLDDWMSYHQNESDEWMRFGAAIYVRRAAGVRIHGLTVTGGQNGIMLAEVDDSIIQGNEITFNSAIGIGLYRSSRNSVRFNALDFNVRGYSHGKYNRGQDSAAILVYEQSNENVFASNSATHSGDGFFLWAGQSTMDTGEGGCNDNIIIGNDFSFAPTNGIEVTFSRNTILSNTIVGCWHGIWGGYSFESEIRGNLFALNDEHIAIEHGQELLITGNTFVGGDQGVRIWERGSQPEDWGYSKNRDVSSRDIGILGNVFDEVSLPVNAERTTRLRFEDNLISPTTDSVRIVESGRVSVEGNRPLTPGGRSDRPMGAPSALESSAYKANAAVPFPDGLPRGRRYMLIDEWGPHDFRSPVIWPRSERNGRVQRFEILGPSGSWRLAGSAGVDSMSAEKGPVPDTLTVWVSNTSMTDLRLDLEYEGQGVVDRFGRSTPAGEPFPFGYAYFFVPIQWDTSFFAYDESTDPRTAPAGFQRLLNGKPVHREATRSLSYGWYGNPAPGVPANYFATLSEGHLTVDPGNYVLELTSDDGVRVWIDDTMAFEDWTWHAPKTALIPVQLGGSHQIRIEHFEIDGYATLIANLHRADD